MREGGARFVIFWGMVKYDYERVRGLYRSYSMIDNIFNIAVESPGAVYWD